MTSIKNIRNILTEITWSLGLLCKSNNINKWSFRKPVNSDKLTKLTDSELYNINDGFNLYTFNTPQAMLYELQHENVSRIWKYEERTEPYRLGDFEGYNHNAARLCDFTIENNNSGGAGTSIKFHCSDILDIINHWKYFEGVRSYVDFVLLIYKYGTEYNVGGSQGVYVYKIKSIVDYDEDGKFSLVIPEILQQNQYEIRLCCSTATSGLGDKECILVNSNSTLSGVWYALPPHTKNVISVTDSGSGGGAASTDFFNYVDISFPRASYDYDNNIISNLSFTNYIVINSATNNTFNLYVEYWYDNSPTPVMIGWSSRTLNINDVPCATININYKDNITTITDAKLDDRINIRAEFNLTVNGKSHRKTINATIDRVIK